MLKGSVWLWMNSNLFWFIEGHFILALLGMWNSYWPSMTNIQCSLFKTLHYLQACTERRCCIQINQLPTKTQVELEDNFIVCFVENMIWCMWSRINDFFVSQFKYCMLKITIAHVPKVFDTESFWYRFLTPYSRIFMQKENTWSISVYWTLLILRHTSNQASVLKVKSSQWAYQLMPPSIVSLAQRKEIQLAFFWVSFFSCKPIIGINRHGHVITWP